MRAMNLTLLTDLYELTMMQDILKTPPTRSSSLTLFTEKTPATADTPSRRAWNRSSNISGICTLPRMTSTICEALAFSSRISSNTCGDFILPEIFMPFPRERSSSPGSPWSKSSPP